MPISADLGAKLESYVDELVASGRYNSKSEVIREGLRLLEERETRLKALQSEIAKGTADSDAGRTRPAEDVLAEMEQKYRNLAAKAQA
jgi:antitoxin ParD1/3/4